ncbi:MAG: hypothetical protein PHF29_00830 [Candidatus Riflebacteria bacterium]|nr:hypothetical protein [Candidatus Riflebacteria bacterium]
MRTILTKDFLEQRMYLLILVCVAVISLLTAAYFKNLDSGIALLILFVLEGPLFVFLTANHQISSEVNANTWQFISSLPISPFKLWVSKFLFTLIYCTVLYAVYILLALITGVELSDLLSFVWQNLGVAVGIPVVILSLGFFTTMMPQGFTMAVLVVLIPVLWGIFSNDLTLVSINYGFATVLLTLVLLTSSFIVFKTDIAMNSSLRGVKSLVVLFLGIVFACFVWGMVDYAADSNIAVNIKGDYSWVPLEDGKKILWELESEVNSWDVIQRKTNYTETTKQDLSLSSLRKIFYKPSNNSHLVMHDLETNGVKVLGDRFSLLAPSKSDNGGNFARIFSGINRFGFYRGLNLAIIDNSGKKLLTLPDELFIFSDDFSFVSENQFAYVEEIKTTTGTNTHLYLYDSENGLKTFYSSDGDFGFASFAIANSYKKNESPDVYAVGVSDRFMGKTILISAKDRTRKVLDIKPFAKMELCGADFILFDEGRWDKNTGNRQQKLVIAKFDGTIMQLGDYGKNVMPIGVSAQGAIIALVSDEDTGYEYEINKIIKIDSATGLAKDLLVFDKPCYASVALSKSGNSAVVYRRFYSGEANTRMINYSFINLQTDEVKMIENLNGMYTKGKFYAVGDDGFLAENYDKNDNGGIFEYDAVSGTAKCKLEYTQITTALRKGGLLK